MRIGILGGGQLSRMLALAGIPLGLSFAFYEPNSHCPAEELGQVTYAHYDDLTSLQQFIDSVDVVTYENENIPIPTLDFISQRKQLYPGIEPIRITQDRLLEKNYFNQLGIETATYLPVNNTQQLINAIDTLGLPCILKKRRNGYDGKGQVVIRDRKQLNDINDAQCSECIVEGLVDYSREISIIGCRTVHADLVFYDICENQHRNGILYQTTNQVDDPVLEQATTHITRFMNALNYVGVCTLEMFQVGDQLIANEAAPRVHNSGHWTIEGALSSQFENHLRAIINWPLGSTRSNGDFTMFNILSQMPDKQNVLSTNGLHLHDYCKSARKNRKLGHITAEVANRAKIKAIIDD